MNEDKLGSRSLPKPLYDLFAGAGFSVALLLSVWRATLCLRTWERSY